MARNISAPILTGGTTPNNTIPIKQAQSQLFKQKHSIKRSKTPNPKHMKNIPIPKPSEIKMTKSQPMETERRHNNKSKSTNLYIPNPPNFRKNKSLQTDNKRLSLPPPVPQVIKKKYANKSGTDSNRSSIKSFESDITTNSDVIHAMDSLAEGDDEYEYYEEEEEEYYEPEPQKPDSPIEPIPKVIKKKRKKNVKVKLRIGSEIEVFSNSKQRWIDGNIVKIKGKLICVAYGTGAGTQKWLEASSKNFRPKMSNIANKMKKPTMNPSITSNTKNYEAKLDNKHKSNDFDDMNNPTPQRFRKSVAFKQKQQVKIKLRIGSPVDVYSVSKNQWINGKLTGIKKDLIRVAYGKGFTTEKWLRANSKQFRPKLDMVDEAVHSKGNKKQNGYNNHKKVKYKNGHNGHNIHGHSYEIDSDEESVVGTHLPQQIFQPQMGPNVYPKPQQQQQQQHQHGAYVTHSLRREQYQQHSIETIKGTNHKRGDLKIKIHGALQLRNNGNYASIKVAEHCLKTKKVASDENPVWKEIVTFSNFRPHIGKTGIINICNKSAIMGEKIIGSAEFELPIVFNRQEKMTIDIADNKNKLSGIVVLEQCVVEQGR